MEDVADTSPSATTEAGPPRLVRTQRALQVVLGLFWILDAALQFQPYMFGKGFVTSFILANTSGQPTVVAWLIRNVGHFLEPHVAVWNTLFALIQLFIGVGLLFRRTARPALAVSFAWVLGVWLFGEGLGMILTGTATALTGAPGSVLMYGLIGLMAWPRRAGERTDFSGDTAKETGVASSAAARGLGGVTTPLVVWSGYWSLAAVLFLLPDNRTRTSVSSAIVGMAPGQPGWFSHFLTSFGHFFSTTGGQTSWALAAVSLVIAFGPLLVRRPGIFLLLGGVLSFVLWVTGQGLLGGILTGSGTDPNTGPLVILLALAMVPARVPLGSTWRSPLSLLFSWRPAVALGGIATVGVALALSASYPVSATETAGMAMSGMVGMAGSASNSASTATCTAGNNGGLRTGLDVNNTPNMLMSGAGTAMDMNGSDATAAAGLNTTKANWHYTGAPIPNAEAQQLLARGPSGPDDIHMASTGCSPEPTFSEEINAVQYVQSTSAAVARFTNPFLAVAAGYVAVSPTDYPVVYYVNPKIMAANAAAKSTLDPARVDGLVFAQTPAGTEVLAAAMYVQPSTVAKAPMPFGALVQWHQRVDVCGPTDSSGTATFAITGSTPCAAGSVPNPTPYTTMVWQVPVAGGPLAIEPPDIQIVEASVMGASSSS
jgi:hypothetical protein